MIQIAKPVRLNSNWLRHCLKKLILKDIASHIHLKIFSTNFHYHASLHRTAQYVTENMIVIMDILFEIKNPTAFSATGQTIIGNLDPESLRKNLLLVKLPWIERKSSQVLQN